MRLKSIEDIESCDVEETIRKAEEGLSLKLSNFLEEERDPIEKAEFKIKTLSSRIDQLKNSIEYLSDSNNAVTSEGRKLGIFHPSQISGCLLSSYYDYMKFQPKNEINATTRLIFDTGTAVHEQIQEYLSEMFGDSFQDEVEMVIDKIPVPFKRKSKLHKNIKIEDGLINARIEGSCDGVLNFKKVRFGIEIKTINDKGFSTLSKPKTIHIAQSMTYMWGLDLPFMLFIYYNKNNSQIKMYGVKFDMEMFLEKSCKRVALILNAIEDNTTPDADGSYFQCKGCGYRYMCPKITKYASYKS